MNKAFVLINADLGSEAELIAELRKLEGVIGAFIVYGVYDVLVEIEAESDQKAKELILSKIRTLKHIRSTLTLTVMP
jgi:DNA-binding Lrp family transcriptional regulator